MHWDINEISEKIKSLKQSISKIQDKEQLYAIKCDIIKLERMLNYLLKVANRNSSIDFVPLKTNPYKPCQIVNECSSAMIPIISFVNNIKHLPWRFCCDRSISMLDYYILVNDFNQNYDPEFGTLFNKMFASKRIELNPRKYWKSSALGICYPLASDKLSFISARFNGKLSSASILVHELAHAYQFNMASDFKQMQVMLNSPLVEAFPKFMEFVFLDYLKETEYRKNAFASEFNLLDNFFVMLEYFGSDFLKANFYEEYNVKKRATYYDLNQMISYILALYMLNLYRQDVKSARKLINEFNFGFKTGIFSANIEAITANELYHGTSDVINNYVKTLKLK
ncbi:MAG: hypothetical protein IJB71_04290 [Bacilli bacterium]|nr:hypothetical protein [Bacilli bacterium]